MISIDSGTEDIAMISETERLILRPWQEEAGQYHRHSKYSGESNGKQGYSQIFV